MLAPMRVGTYTFESKHDPDGPLILEPRKKFDLKCFLSEEDASLRGFSRSFPFFVIGGAVLNEGLLIGSQGDGVNTHFHYDEGEIIVLANNFELNDRGRTEWVPDGALIRAFRSELNALREFTSSGFYSPHLTESFAQLFDESHTREAINQLFGALYCTVPMPPELEDFFKRINRHVAREIMTCDWEEHPKSALVFNNALGFHRGVYNEGAGQELHRVVLP